MLKEVADELLREMTAEVTDLHEKKLITIQYLWTLFPKGIMVVSRSSNHESLLEVLSFERDTATALCRYVDFDGSNYGTKHLQITQPSFWGTRPISELSVYPLSFHKNREQLEKDVLVRSRKVLGYQKMMHAEYGQPDLGGLEEHSASSLLVSLPTCTDHVHKYQLKDT